MHYGFLSLGLLSGATAAAAAFHLGGGMFVAIIFYMVFSFCAVCLAAIIWALGPSKAPVMIRPNRLGHFPDP